MREDVERIFSYAYSSPRIITDDFNETSFRMMKTALVHLQFLGFVGCKWEMKYHRTFVFGSKKENPFRTLSVNYNIFWKGETINVDLSCEYPDWICFEEGECLVRLYTKHPVSHLTIYAYMHRVWNYKPPEYLFHFLLGNYGWFVDNFSSIKSHFEQTEGNTKPNMAHGLLRLEDSLLSGSAFFAEREREAAGRLIASELVKETFVYH